MAAFGAGHMGMFSCNGRAILVKEMSVQWMDIPEKPKYV